ncbi:glutamate--cysteine ligase [Polymorphum gilvum]|uniref:Glutamate--cysteine ligase n=1 Tax=Polymorphum gilvum (strain LMG 25793 / CGMCC 1.9160 / SL003B-26A1) TaxID=991905 RepID=F2J0W6_POLGS|nr:glutamate--cysteine ligase [Polymorphum gilvum]ADZ71912.1 Putative glutamate--cysteine ligase protein [Polymorphum gilvum SL003B-26A1]
MARDTVDSTPIEGVSELAATLDSGCKPDDRFRIGTEHEKFGFFRDSLKPIPYGGPRGIEAVLKGMEGLLGWERISDNGNIIGLADPVGGGAISIEPGGQFELSGAPLENLHQTCRETNSHLAQVRQIAEPLGIGFLGLGMTPTWTRDEVPVMPKSRYEIMTRYMPKVGSLGLDMMYRTSTIQVNLDFSSEADMVTKLRVGLALQPIATAIFANSPFTDGRPNGFKSFRAEIWKDTDADRTGPMPFAFEPGFGFEAYVDWAIDVPMYFVKRGDTYYDVTGTTFRAFMNGALKDTVPDGLPTIGDWNNHLSTLFPDVRLKKYLEMRGADGGPWRRICALPALWVGLLYDRGVLDQAWQLVRDWTAEEREALRNEVPRLALQTPFRSGTVLDIARETVALSREGLKRRARLNDGGQDERVHLATVEEGVAAGLSPADQMLKRYEGAWNRDLSRAFEDYAY